jgi:hypothetical protein
MTHDQIREMVRRVNPIPDPNMLETVDAPVLTTERRMEMQTDDRVMVEDGGANRWRGPLIGIAAAAVILAGVAIFIATNADPVAEPAPNATELTLSMEFQPIDPGAYFADTDLDESTRVGGTFVIEGNGWTGLAAGALKSYGDEADNNFVALLIAEVDTVWEPACDAGSTTQVAANTAEGLADQFVAAGFTATGALTPVSAFGHEGYHLATEVSCVSDGFTVWAGPNRDYRSYGAGEHLEYWFLDVEGTPVLVEASWTAESPEEDVAELRAVIDTLVITP